MNYVDWNVANALDREQFRLGNISLTELRKRYFDRLQVQRMEAALALKRAGNRAASDRFMEKIQHDDIYATDEQRGR